MNGYLTQKMSHVTSFKNDKKHLFLINRFIFRDEGTKKETGEVQGATAEQPKKEELTDAKKIQGEKREAKKTGLSERAGMGREIFAEQLLRDPKTFDAIRRIDSTKPIESQTYEVETLEEILTSTVLAKFFDSGLNKNGVPTFEDFRIFLTSSNLPKKIDKIRAKALERIKDNAVEKVILEKIKQAGGTLYEHLKKQWQSILEKAHSYYEEFGDTSEKGPVGKWMKEHKGTLLATAGAAATSLAALGIYALMSDDEGAEATTEGKKEDGEGKTEKKLKKSLKWQLLSIGFAIVGGILGTMGITKWLSKNTGWDKEKIDGFLTALKSGKADTIRDYIEGSGDEHAEEHRALAELISKETNTNVSAKAIKHVASSKYKNFISVIGRGEEMLLGHLNDIPLVGGILESTLPNREEVKNLLEYLKSKKTEITALNLDKNATVLEVLKALHKENLPASTEAESKKEPISPQAEDKKETRATSKAEPGGKPAEVREAMVHAEYGEMVPLKDALHNYQHDVLDALSGVTKFIKENPGVVSVGGLYLASIESVRGAALGIAHSGYDGFIGLAKIPFKAAKNYPLSALFTVSAILVADHKLNIVDSAGNMMVPKDTANFKKYIRAKIKEGGAWAKESLPVSDSDIDKVVDVLTVGGELQKYIGEAPEALEKVMVTGAEKLTLSKEKLIQEANIRGFDVFETDLHVMQTEHKEDTKEYGDYKALLEKVESLKEFMKQGRKLTREDIATQLGLLGQKVGIIFTYDNGHIIWLKIDESGELPIVKKGPKKLGIDPALDRDKAAEVGQKFAVEENTLNALAKIPEAGLIQKLRLLTGDILFEDAKTDEQAKEVLERKMRDGWSIAWHAGGELLIFEPAKGIWHKYASGPFDVLPDVVKLMRGSKDVSATEVAVEYANGILPVYILGQASALLRLDFKSMGVGQPLLRAALYPVEMPYKAVKFTFRHIILNALLEKQPLKVILSDPKNKIYSEYKGAVNSWARVLGGNTEIRHSREMLIRMYEAKGYLHESIYESIRMESRRAYLTKALDALKGTGEVERVLEKTQLSSETSSIREAITKIDAAIAAEEAKIEHLKAFGTAPSSGTRIPGTEITHEETSGTGLDAEHRYKFRSEEVTIKQSELVVKAEEISRQRVARGETMPSDTITKEAWDKSNMDRAAKMLVEEKLLTPVEVKSKPGTFRIQGQEFTVPAAELDAKIASKGITREQAAKEVLLEKATAHLEIEDVKIVNNEYRYKMGGEWVEPLDPSKPAKVAELKAKFIEHLKEKGLNLDLDKIIGDAKYAKAFRQWTVFEKAFGTAGAVFMFYHLITAQDKKKAFAETAVGFASFMGVESAAKLLMQGKIKDPRILGGIAIISGLALAFGINEPMSKLVEEQIGKVKGSYEASEQGAEFFEKGSIRLISRNILGSLDKGLLKAGIEKFAPKVGLEGLGKILSTKVESQALKKFAAYTAEKGLLKWCLEKLGWRGATGALLLADDATVIGVLDDAIAAVLWASMAKDVLDIALVIRNAYKVKDELQKRKDKNPKNIRAYDAIAQGQIDHKLLEMGLKPEDFSKLDDKQARMFLSSLGMSEVKMRVEHEGVSGYVVYTLKDGDPIGTEIYNDGNEKICGISGNDSYMLDQAMMQAAA